MQIYGFNKTTLLDYPEHIAATVFTGGCNFRCPFCHNGELVLDPARQPSVAEEEVLYYLKKRQGILQGVCVTGGEPTLQRDLRAFLQKIKELEYPIKLDTNGYRPDVLKSLCEQGLVDYVAMDIKTCKERYPLLAGIPSIQMEPIEESVDYLKSCHIPYEFRTTVVKELHSADDFQKIGPWISGCPNYYLQNFVDSGNVLEDGFSGCTKEELLAFLEIVKPFVGQAAIRGIDY